MNRSRYFNRLRFKEFSLGLILTLFTFVASAEPTGSFRYPTDNKSFDGNLLISGSVQDTEALGSIFVRFNNNSATQILVCSACDTQDSNGDGIFRRSFTDAGINPRDYNLSIGSHTAQLIHQGTGAEQVLDQVQFSWEPPEITGINVNRVFGEFTISWSALTGYRRYNLYIASEANISPGNIDSLPDNMTYRALTGTTQRIQGVNDELGLFGIVTGTDTSGESAYSQVFRIEALDNQDPTTGPDAFTLSEDTSTSGNVLTNDADPEGEALTASLVNNPTNGTVELSSNGNFTYTPNTNFNGTDQFNYTANDPRGGTQLGTVTLTVTSVNDAPVANGDSYTTTEDVPIAVTAAAGLLINDSDVDGDVLTVSLVSGPQNGSLSLNSDGSFNYLSVSEFSGSDTFTYQVTDTAGASDTAVVTIEITGINDPPVANNDNFLTSEDVTLSVNASGGVLVNDSDADALFGNITDELTVTLVTGVNNGTLTLGSDGSFQYTPADNFFGNDSFVYLVTDSAGSTDSATAFIEIASVNDAPLAQSDSYQVDEDNVLNVDSNNGLTANDSDVESASSQLTVSITTPPLNGSVELGNSGAFVYTPNANFFGTDTLTYQISDPQGATASAQANFVVNSINDAPLANDDVYQINEDETLQVSEVTIGLLANDSDPDFSEQDKFTQLTVAVLAAPEIGELNLQPNGTFTYSPASNFFGSVIFSYQVTDPEGLTASASVTINIADAPDLPIAVDDSYLLDEDSTLLIAASEGVLVNDSDPSNSGITASILTETASGTLLFNSDGSFDYQPNENFNGPDSFVYQITNGANLTATATVTLNVTPINDAPVGVNDVLVINESDTITFNPLENDTDAEDDPLRILSASAEIGQLNFTENTITYTAIQNSTTDVISYTLADPSGAESSAIVNVNINNVQEAPIAADDIAETNEDTAVVIFPLENDSDPDGDNLTASIQSVSNGTATLASDTSISFTPDANFNGTATISYFASDPAGNMDGGTITINVLPVNDAPVAQNDEATAPEGATIEFSPLGNDTDVDGDVLIITSAAAVSGTVNFSQSLITYTAPGTPGQDTITYTIADPAGETSSANISITVSNIQDAPVAVDDLVSTDEDTPVIITPLSNDIDEDGDALTLSIVSVSSGTATLDNNTVSYTPAANFNGTASIVYSVSDPANNSDTATITITVNPVNDAPVANNDTVTVQEDATISVSPVENDVDIDGDSLTVEIVSVSSGTAIVEGNIINYTPVANFNGTAIITYSITDPSGSSASATITVTVTAVNDAPVANNDTVSTPEDTSVTISPLLNDVDADGDELTLSVLSVSAGTAVVDGSIITYTPVANDTNTATIVYQITDPSSSFDTATITVNIGANNDTPIAVNDTATTVEDTPVQISPLLNDSDPDGDVLRVEVVSVSSGTTTINNNIISYVPATDFNGEATITYSVTDPSGSSATAIISVTVTPVNDAPVANTDNVTTNEDTTVQISPLSNDTDVDNDILTATLGTISSGTATIANNVITYTPEPNFSGVASITYTATDPSGATAPGNINITVLAVNDTPIANDDSIAIAEDSPVLITPLTNDLDPDGDSLVLAIISTSSGTATLSGDTINYSPAANFNGTATITYSITDPSGASATATITVTIAAVNDNPVAVNDNVTTSEDTSIDITPLSNDTDVENDTLSFIINSATNGTFQIISATVVRFTPTANFNGAATMQYTVTDPSGGSATGEIIINVTAVNDAPIAVTDTATVNEGETIVISPITNDSDVEGDNLTITAATTTIGSVTVNTDATTLTYTAPSGFSGVAVISYTLTDATTSVTGTVNVTVNDVNFGPTAVNDTFNVNAGETNTLNVVSNDTDPDGDNLTITAATTTLGTVTIVTDSVSSTLSYAAPADTTATATISYTISDAGGLTSSATATVNITEQPLTGDFDSDGDGMPDVSATSTGTNFNVTFGDNVDAVYYFENGELVSISANDAGVFELTIAPTSTGNKGAKTTGGVKGSNANDFELPSGTNQVFFTINGVEYSFTTTNLDQPSPNIAFNPPTTLDTSFESQISHDFFLRFPSFSGPLRLGLDNGEHYILGSDGIAEVRGTDFNFNGIWLETDGILFIDYNDSLETTQSVSVFDLDDDNSDGKALNIITKAEADAHFAATNDQFIDVFVKETREVFTLTRDNRIYIDAFVERFLSYRVDATVYPDITSAQVSTIGAVADEILAVELWDLTTAKIEKITFSDIQHGIATDIPRITNSQFSDIVADTCTFTEITTGSQSGSGLCIFNDQPFTWNIVSGVLNMDFGSDVTVQYRWIDALAVENTFSMEISEGVGSSLSQFSAHVYWLPLTNFTDSNISSILSNNYFDSGFSLTNPEARDDNRAVKDSDVFGFYFNSNGFAKNLSSSTEFTGTQITDDDRRWSVNNGLVTIDSVTNVNSGDTFAYVFDQCSNSFDANCFIWRFREWKPIALDGTRLWVWETVIQNESAFGLQNSIVYQELLPPRLQFYELNTTVPGAPNSINFNQEPVQINQFEGQAEFNTTANIDVLKVFADPEADALSVLNASPRHGSITINSDNTLAYTPESNFSGFSDIDLAVSDGINTIFTRISLQILDQNVAPVANDDTATALAGITTTLNPLSNDTDSNNDDLFITSASSDNGTVTTSTDRTQLLFTSPTNFFGPAIITYSISDERGGTATATMTVTVSQPQFSGSYDLDNSNTDDFTISVANSTYTVTFGSEVSSVYFTENGQRFILARESSGNFVFDYPAGSSLPATLTYVINGIEYTISPDNLSATTPGLVFGGTNTLVNDFGTATSYQLISRFPTHNSALATGFDNGTLYDLQSGGTGSYSSPKLSDNITWTQTAGSIQINFANPQEQLTFYSVYDLDDQVDGKDAALGVITKAEADAYFAATNTEFVDVNVATVSQLITANRKEGYYYDTIINETQRFRIDSSSHPEITSAENGVNVSTGDQPWELLNSNDFSFAPVTASDIVGTIYLSTPESAGNVFSQFSADTCTLSESSTGSNAGSGSCVLSSETFSWSIQSDNSVLVTFASSQLSVVYRWLNTDAVENTLFIKVTDSTSSVFSTLDYWFRSSTQSASNVNSLISGHYVESSDNITNPFNFDSFGQLNDSVGDGYFFNSDGLAKEIFASTDAINNQVEVSDFDHRWTINNVDVLQINALSNASSSDTFRYRYSQCTDSADQNCYIWRIITMQPLAIDGNRLWVMESELTDPDFGFFDGNISYESTGFPEIKFYEVSSSIPGDPNSISFNQEPVFTSFPTLTATVNNRAIFNLLSSIGDPENDALSIIDAQANNATVLVNGDNSISYTPDSNFAGGDILYITVTDGINVTELVTEVLVQTTNTAPVANDDSENVIGGGRSYIFDVLSNDTDAENDELTIVSISTTATGVSIGSQSKTLEYLSPGSANSIETVFYTIDDGKGGTAEGRLTILFLPNANPDAFPDTAGPVVTGSTITIFPLLNDTDLDNDPLTLTTVSSSIGSAIINSDEVSFDFTPTVSPGTFTISYGVTDGFGGGASANIDVTVVATNSAPVANDDTENAVGGHSYTFLVLNNDTDVDSDILSITNLATTASGFSIATGAAAINYTAPASVSRNESVVYTVSDGNGGTATATLTVSLVPNSNPILTSDTAGPVLSGNTITITPLANDIDPDGDSLIITNVSTTQGAATINNDQVSFNFTPSITSGTALINYDVSDGFGGTGFNTVSVTVTTANNAPVANNDSVVVTPGTLNFLSPLSNDTDADGDNLTITSSSATVGTSLISNGDKNLDYTSPSTVGTAAIDYTISDGNGGTASAVISVLINNKPVAVNDTFSISEGRSGSIFPLNNDSDPDSDPFTLSNVISPSNTTNTFIRDGSGIDYFAAEPGSFTFDYEITDSNGLTDTATISLTVTNRPVAVDDVYTVNLGQSTNLTPLDNDTDPDTPQTSLTIVGISGTSHIGTPVISSDARSINYTPPAQAALNGATSDTVRYRVQDDASSISVGTMTINFNFPPDAVDDNASGLAGQTITISPLTNDTDAGDTFVISNVSASSGSASKLSDTQIAYSNPTAGTYTVNYTITDSNGATDSANITVIVTNNPTAIDDTFTVQLAQATQLAPLDNDTDTETANSGLTLTNVTGFSHGTAVIDSGNRTFTYTSNTAAQLAGTKTDSGSYTMTDSDGGTSTANITININSAPVPQSDTLSVITPHSHR